MQCPLNHSVIDADGFTNESYYSSASVWMQAEDCGHNYGPVGLTLEVFPTIQVLGSLHDGFQIKGVDVTASLQQWCSASQESLRRIAQ